MTTTPHARLDTGARDRLTLYLLGGMSEGEARELERHLSICSNCRHEVDVLRPAVESLALSALEAEPPRELFGRIMRRVRGEPFTLLLAAERAWLPADVPGVELCQLSLESEQERQTLLIRMQPGASLPNHIHGGTEECFVVSGDLRDGDLRLETNDYVRFDTGTSHTVMTEGGCLLLVNSSLRDRPVERGGQLQP